MSRTALVFAGLALLVGCSAFDDTSPSTWVEFTVSDLYFVGDLPSGAATASVIFATAPLDRQRLPVDFAIHLARFRVIGDNYYANTLDYLDLREPVEGEARWLWAGTIVLPPFLGGPAVEPARIGVQIRGMPYKAMSTVPLAHRYCTIDLLGAGVLDCEPWADAIFHTKVICRGAVGQLIACQGIGYEIVPEILITGIAQPQGGNMAGKQFQYLIVAGVTFTHGEDGWRYSRPGAGERGPFEEPEEAAKDAAQYLRWVERVRGYPSHLLQDDGIVRLVEALRTEKVAEYCDSPDCEGPSHHESTQKAAP
jgi:hypothetical protein